MTSRMITSRVTANKMITNRMITALNTSFGKKSDYK
jgi:hypothetical protein